MYEPGGNEGNSAAAADYLRLLAREPNSLRFAEYADHLRRMGKLPDATAVCEHGLARHPGYATGHVVMAEILAAADMKEKASAELREALRLDPCHPRAHLALGELYLIQGERTKAAAAFEAALLYSPGLPEAQAGLAEAKGQVVQAKASDPPRGSGERKAGERPGWLTADKTQVFVELVAAIPLVRGAAVVGAGGKVVAGAMPGCSEAGIVVSVLNDARSLSSRLGAGRLRSFLVCSGEAEARYTPLGELTLVVEMGPGADADETERRLGEAIGAEPQGSELRKADG